MFKKPLGVIRTPFEREGLRELLGYDKELRSVRGLLKVKMAKKA